MREKRSCSWCAMKEQWLEQSSIVLSGFKSQLCHSQQCVPLQALVPPSVNPDNNEWYLPHERAAVGGRHP